MASFKDGLRRFMGDRKLNVAHIALAADAATSTVENWYYGRTEPQLALFQRLCARYPADGELPAFEDYFKYCVRL